MEKIWTAAFCLLTALEYVSFYVVVFGKKPRVSTAKAAGLVVSVLALAWLCLDWQEWLFDYRRVLLFLVCSVVLFFSFPLSFRENLKLFLSAFAVLTLIEGICDCILRVFFELGDKAQMVAHAALIVLLLWGYYFFTARKGTHDIFRLSARIQAVAAAIVYLLALLMNVISWYLIELSFGGPLKYLGLLVAFGSVASIVLLFALVYYFNGTQNYSMQVEILERQNEQQREYFAQLLKKEQDTRQFRHDLIAELLELKSYSESGEYGKLKEYLAEMLGEISGISERQYDVGNDIVNTIINYYFLPVRETCKVTVRGYMYEEQAVSQRDLCIIVSNLVRNAVEATANLQGGQGEIVFEVQQGERTLNIYMENTMEGELRFRNGMPATTKKDCRNHGFGLGNVRAVVGKYKGSYECKAENGRYIVDIFV